MILGYTFDNTTAFELLDKNNQSSGMISFGEQAGASTFNNVTYSQASISEAIRASDCFDYARMQTNYIIKVEAYLLHKSCHSTRLIILSSSSNTVVLSLAQVGKVRVVKT